ncbi:hypothetical protein Y1Q_0015880 [Alligator mississippiensis]|uniref:Uncharacterized protein n=1 Tax=Alligator mississippiensis TaxID=8496 RepID=A0A151MHA9_ALLMI|nr:hypothetical protein Y1Q_0015880 [Alligator mississippiensis]
MEPCHCPRTGESQGKFGVQLYQSGKIKDDKKNTQEGNKKFTVYTTFIQVPGMAAHTHKTWTPQPPHLPASAGWARQHGS